MSKDADAIRVAADLAREKDAEGLASELESIARRSNWVSVNEELPPFNQTVLIAKRMVRRTGKPYETIIIGFRKQDRRIKPQGWRWKSRSGGPCPGVIAWMPLPEFPTNADPGGEDF